jgi:hypothetical protein
MDREWNSTTAYLGDKGKGDEYVKDDMKPVGLFTRVVRSTRNRVKNPFV